ncbi:MAG: hypothetical protein ACREM8_09010, partial [Vulcanimicrobiaceae bacterium]
AKGAGAAPKYRRKRNGSKADEPAYEPVYGGEELDPLDAQAAGFHDDELALGHEEIHLNLPEDPTPANPDGTPAGTAPTARE